MLTMGVRPGVPVSKYWICITVIITWSHLCIGLVDGRRSGGYYSGGSGGSYRTGRRFFPMWLPWHSRTGQNSGCDDEDADCQEESPSGWLDLLLLLLIGIGLVVCCYLCAKASRQQKNMAPDASQQQHRDTSIASHQEYCAMQDEQQQGNTVSATSNRQYNHHAVASSSAQGAVVVQGRTITTNSRAGTIPFQQQAPVVVQGRAIT